MNGYYYRYYPELRRIIKRVGSNEFTYSDVRDLLPNIGVLMKLEYSGVVRVVRKEKTIRGGGRLNVYQIVGVN